MLPAVARKFPKLVIACMLALSCGPLASMAHARKSPTDRPRDMLALYQLNLVGAQAVVDEGGDAGRRPTRRG